MGKCISNPNSICWDRVWAKIQREFSEWGNFFIRLLHGLSHRTSNSVRYTLIERLLCVRLGIEWWPKQTVFLSPPGAYTLYGIWTHERVITQGGKQCGGVKGRAHLTQLGELGRLPGRGEWDLFRWRTEERRSWTEGIESKREHGSNGDLKR